MNLSKNKFFSALAFLFLLLFSCDTGNNNPQIETKRQIEVLTKPHINSPDFNSDSAFNFIKAQADMGPRTPGSKAHEQCANYFEKKFKQYGAEVTVQKATVTTFDEKKWIAKNIIASFNPENSTRILLCAHWDSRPFCDEDSNIANLKKACPGVNDGASGAGVLLEIARALSKEKTKVGIDIMMIDVEDYGVGQTDLGPEEINDDWGLGSQYWSKNPHKPGYIAKFGILLDLVGTKNIVFPLEATSTYYAGQIQKDIWATGQNIGYGNYFVNTPIHEITDDHLYINKFANIPCVDIIGYDTERKGFFPEHHTLNDDIKIIDKNTLKAVGQTVLEVIYNEIP